MKAFNVHLIVNNKFRRYWSVDHIPSVGDEIRLGPKEFVRVTRRVFVADESQQMGQRVNIGCVKAK